MDLQVNTVIPPVEQPYRRIPFSVRPKLVELENPMVIDVIQKVDKPADWVSPVVIIPKWTVSEIRFNVDTREANKAIPRVHTVMPTLDDIIRKPKGATVFSHVDMNHGYHQLELKENSRDITTSATHVGLYRY